METRLHLPESETPITIGEVLSAIRRQGVKAEHDEKSWGDWINLEGFKTVVSIESVRGLTRHATLEIDESDPVDLEYKLVAAFRELKWYASDEDGEYQL